MAITRRGFITTTGAAIAAGIVATDAFGQTRVPRDTFPIPVESTNDPLSYLTREHFSPFVGTEFRGSSDAGDVQFWLAAADDRVFRQKTRRGQVVRGYSLVFQSGTDVADGIYSFDHSTLGKFSLFISGFGLAGTKYQAVVNRISQR